MTMIMIILGWVFSISGLFSTVIGAVLYSDADSAGYGFYKYMDNSSLESARVLLIVGIIALVLGIVLLVVGYLLRSSERSRNSGSNGANTRKCLNCGNILPVGVRFCPRCGNNMDMQGR